MLLLVVIKLNAGSQRTHINKLWKLNMKMYKTPTRMRRQAHVRVRARKGEEAVEDGGEG